MPKCSRRLGKNDKWKSGTKLGTGGLHMDPQALLTDFPVTDMGFENIQSQ